MRIRYDHINELACDSPGATWNRQRGVYDSAGIFVSVLATPETNAQQHHGCEQRTVDDITKVRRHFLE